MDHASPSPRPSRWFISALKEAQSEVNIRMQCKGSDKFGSGFMLTYSFICDEERVELRNTGETLAPHSFSPSFALKWECHISYTYLYYSIVFPLSECLNN